MRAKWAVWQENLVLERLRNAHGNSTKERQRAIQLTRSSLKIVSTWYVSEARNCNVAIANHDRIENLFFRIYPSFAPPLNHPLVQPPTHRFNSDHLRVELDQLGQPKPSREIIQIRRHFRVTRKISRVPVLSIREGEVREPHQGPGQVGSEREIQAAVNHLVTQRVRLATARFSNQRLAQAKHSGKHQLMTTSMDAEHKMKDLVTTRVAALVLLSSIISLAWITPSQSISSYPPSSPKPKCPPIPTPEAKCPRDTLKFGGCTSWLGLVSGVVGAKPSPKCCTLLQGISELEAALCLCTALKANVLGVVHIEMSIAISMMLSGCKKKIPEGFKC
ncbi:hypothetical protein Cgig2_013099 [Carnegiea gigantea]|uniref:Bifunctional inhibitor/plant lipid transfer protein/seed storage helical domain-containing protein n=1 Tax=Carnegiea gigantea TaxID=171969 RepID=A0A9Q1KQ26_9CARY|nr:hypothetical protein Cgig2_013099 [Carnegiea gigantea]